MVKCEVIKEFTLERFNELQNIQRKRVDTQGKLYVGDTFECNEELAKYLMGNNTGGNVVVKVIEVKPEIKKIPIGESVQPIEKVIEAKIEELKPKKKKSSKK